MGLTLIFRQNGFGSFQIALQLSIVTQLENEVDKMLVLKEGKEFEDRGVLETRMNRDLLLHSTHHPGRCHQLFVDLRIRTNSVGQVKINSQSEKCTCDMHMH